MFNTISWNEFLTATAFLVGAYYAVTGLLLYNKELTALVTGKKRLFPPVSKVQNVGELMGGVSSEIPPSAIRKLTVEADDIQVHPVADAETPIELPEPARHNNLTVGTVADLLHEIEMLAGVIAHSNSSADESVSLFQSVLSRYPQLVGTNYQNAISLVIQGTCIEKCRLDPELVEVKSWWPTPVSDNL